MEYMKKVALAVVAIMVMATFSFAQGQNAKTFKGEIMDSMCASMGGHSQAAYESTHTHTPKDCTLACVKAGSKFVLYNKAKKTTLQLSDQDKARDFAGQEVKVTGTYDKATKTIHVSNIEAAS
ncbi:MAG TPA: DUF5818 domain-containing protein [Terriglobia bacterium]|nr:DUF5818 domain-containing protein [Terriglobia bacterium]